MGKKRTVVISGEPEEKPKGKKGAKKDLKKSQRDKKGVKVPGLKGGERVVAVGADLSDEAPKEEKEGKQKKAVKKQKRKVRTRGKKYQEATSKIDKTKTYPGNKAIKLVKETSYSSFNGSVEFHATVKKTGLSANLTLPHSTGKSKKIEIADEKTIKKLKDGKIDFDVLLATTEMMPKLVPFAKLLGPKGLMPNPKNGTVIKSKKDAEKFSADSLTIKTERKAPLIHTTIGKVKLENKKLAENLDSVVEAIGKNQIKKAYLASTMGPSVRLEVS